MNHQPIPRRAALGVLAATAAAWSLPAAAQAYPAKVVTIVVPFGAGNAYDVMVRALADQLRQATGQAFIVDARQGALGGIASSAVTRAAPDGYTILFGANSTHAANVHCSRSCRMTRWPTSRPSRRWRGFRRCCWSRPRCRPGISRN